MTTSRRLMPALAITMIASWGSLYYAFAVLARPIQTELHWSAELTVGAYSLALLLAGLSAYPVGKIIDRRGGRDVMSLGSLAAAILFLALSQVSSIYAFYAIWIGLGITMAMTLYEPAFAVIVGAYPHGYRKRIGFLTLAGGFASTVFWPLTHALVSSLGWRGAVLVIAAVHFLICAPLHWFAVPTATPKDRHPPLANSDIPAPITPGLRKILRQPSFWLIGFCFMTFGLVTAAMAVHIIPMLESRGVGPAAAVALAALIGPMQVSGRVMEVVSGTRVPVLVLGGVTVLFIPVALTILLFGPAAPTLLYVFIVFYGAGVGLMTIVKATAPAEIFGRDRYASLSGALATPTIAARALGPIAATAVLTAFGNYNAVLTLMLGVAAAGAVSYWLATATRAK